MLHHDTPCCTMLHHDTPCYTMLHHDTPCYTMLHHVAPCYTMIHHVAPCYTMIHHVAPCYTMIHHVTQSYFCTDVTSSRRFMSTRTQAKLRECEMRSRSATNSMICSVSNKPFNTNYKLRGRQTTWCLDHIKSRLLPEIKSPGLTCQCSDHWPWGNHQPS